MTANNQTKSIQLLQGIPLFSSLDARIIEQLVKESQVFGKKKGEAIFLEGEQAKGLHVVLDGVVKVCHASPEGQELVLHVLRSGHLFGEAALFQQSTYPASAYAEKSCHLLYIPGTSLFELLRKHPDMAFAMLGALSVRLRYFARKLQAAHDHNALQRLAAYLLHRLSLSPDSTSLHMDVSQETMASMLGIRRETLSRMLSQLEQEGIVRKEKKTLVVVDPKALQKNAGNDDEDE